MKVRAVFGFVAAALLIPSIGSADFVYTGIDVGYVDVEFDTGVGSLDGDGYRFAGAWELNERFFLQGEFQDQSYDSFLGASIDGSAYEFGLGYHHSFSSTLDFVGTLSYAEEEVNVAVPGFAAGFDQDGLVLGGGLRARLADSFEVGAMLKWEDMDLSGSDTGFELLGRYFFTNKLAFTLATDLDDDFDTMTFGFRAEF